MTAQMYSIQTFGFRSFVNVLQNVILNLKDGFTSAILDSLILEVEKAESELKAFYNHIQSAENQDLMQYTFDDIIENFEDNSEKLENCLKVLNTIKKGEKLEDFKTALDNFYTTLVQCKIELSFISAELDYETNQAS